MSNINNQLSELLELQSQIKRLEFNKAQLTDALKLHMTKKNKQVIENEHGKVSLIKMTQRRLDKELLMSLGVEQETIDSATREVAIEQLRISIR